MSSFSVSVRTITDGAEIDAVLASYPEDRMMEIFLSFNKIIPALIKERISELKGIRPGMHIEFREGSWYSGFGVLEAIKVFEVNGEFLTEIVMVIRQEDYFINCDAIWMLRIADHQLLKNELQEIAVPSTTAQNKERARL